MRKTLRLGLLAAAAATLLASASSALGAYAPKLAITRADEVTDIKFSQTDADDATAKVQILVPAGFTASLTQSPGTQLGTLDGSVIAGAFGGATVPVAGTIIAGDTSNAALRQTAKACTGTETHAAIWLLNVTAAGQSLPNPVPLFVDPLTTPPFSAFASASIQLCLPPPPLAAFQIKLLEASLHMANAANVISPPAAPGAYRWTAVNTPYKADNSVNAAGTVETQGIDASPVDPSFAAKRITKTRRVKHKRYTDIFYSYSVRLSGTVEAGGQAVGGANVDLMAGEQKLDSASTNDSGAFTKTLKLTKTTSYHAVYTKESAALLGTSCVPPLPLAPGINMPCASVTNGGFVATTEEVRVVKPKLTHKRIKHKTKKKPKH
jgi:hypothetical protein